MQDKVDDFRYVGKIVPKPRMTRSDVWKKRPIVVEYYKFKDNIRKQAFEQNFELGSAFAIKFGFEIPKSRKDVKEGDYHIQRPDLDNLLKAVQDCLLKEDSGIYLVVAFKQWSESGDFIEITNIGEEEIEDLI